MKIFAILLTTFALLTVSTPLSHSADAKPAAEKEVTEVVEKEIAQMAAEADPAAQQRALLAQHRLWLESDGGQGRVPRFGRRRVGLRRDLSLGQFFLLKIDESTPTKTRVGPR